MTVSFPHTDLLIEHLAQGTKVSSILFDHVERERERAVACFALRGIVLKLQKYQICFAGAPLAELLGGQCAHFKRRPYELLLLYL